MAQQPPSRDLIGSKERLKSVYAKEKRLGKLTGEVLWGSEMMGLFTRWTACYPDETVKVAGYALRQLVVFTK